MKKATYVHQVNVAILRSLLMEAYDANEQSYDVWLANQRKKSQILNIGSCVLK